jgi:quercetin dioxygenase-like cupin family protein
MTVIDGIPAAIHRGIDELPFVDIGDGSQLQVMHVDTDRGLWIIRNRFAPGTRVQTHKHTGEVWAFTLAGSWKYEEYPEVNRAGSYLYEPAGSIHTLKVLDDNTELTDVIFHMTGSNLNLDADGNVESVYDGAGTLEFYLAVCEANGFGRPPVVGA